MEKRFQNIKRFLGPLVFLLIVVITYLVFYSPKTDNDHSQTELRVTKPSPSPTTSSSPFIYVEPKIEGNVYEIKVTRQEGVGAGALHALGTRNFYFYDALTTRRPYGLDPDDTVAMKAAIGNTYFVTTNDNLHVGDFLSSDGENGFKWFFEVQVIAQKNSLLPYLQDPKYCERDDDCIIRYDWCKKGAWNVYSNFREGTGCGWGQNDGQTKEILAGLNCPISPYGIDQVIANYSGVRCIQNTCVAQDPSFSCITNDSAWIEDGGGFK